MTNNNSEQNHKKDIKNLTRRKLTPKKPSWFKRFLRTLQKHKAISLFNLKIRAAYGYLQKIEDKLNFKIILLILFFSCSLIGVSFIFNKYYASTYNSADSDDHSLVDLNDDYIDNSDILHDIDNDTDDKEEDFNEFEGVLPQDAEDIINKLVDSLDDAIRTNQTFEHVINKGDTLITILSESGLDQSTIYNLAKKFPDLRKINEGQTLQWYVDDGTLVYLNWIISTKKTIIYELDAKNNLVQRVEHAKAIQKEQIIQTVIDKNLVNSLLNQGLTSFTAHSLADQAQKAVKLQLNLAKLNPNDQLVILFQQEYIADNPTNTVELKAIHIVSKGKKYYAMLADNGYFYDEKGKASSENSITKTTYETVKEGDATPQANKVTTQTFARRPTNKQFRVSSKFNLRRKHPITGKIRPHKGVDWAMPTGTKIIAPADGVVLTVSNQPNGAGRFIIISHGPKYQTVYMHLKSSLVKVGAKVKKGQTIALSGNSGRSTGPHLHYEIRIFGNPVDPLAIKLPVINTGDSGTGSQQTRKVNKIVHKLNLSDKEKTIFLAKFKKIEPDLEFKSEPSPEQNAEPTPAQNSEPTPTLTNDTQETP